jgi:hypothetical protein
VGLRGPRGVCRVWLKGWEGRVLYLRLGPLVEWPSIASLTNGAFQRVGSLFPGSPWTSNIALALATLRTKHAVASRCSLRGHHTCS